MRDHDAVVTLWFVNTDEPGPILANEPKADRGFGRKLLALMNPRWPISVIGQFPLNRSASASSGEFYIAGYPGITVIQTVVEDMTMLSTLKRTLLRAVDAPTVYAFAINPDTGFGGIAHWSHGEIKRSFCARRNRVYEDIGLPEPFENPFWAGERGSTPQHSIDLPFAPIDLVADAQTTWLGVPISATGPDLEVVGYAIDGRKEPRVPQRRPRKDVNAIVDEASAKLGLGSQYKDYDDYEEAPVLVTEDDFLSRTRSALSTSMRFTRRALRKAGRGADALRDRLRHTDRP